MQPRQRRANITVVTPITITNGSGPEDFGGRGGARPYDRIEVLWA
jgi:hypothetical protein